MTASPTRTYPQIRFSWCIAALKSLLRRWSVYIVIGLLILGGTGAGGPAAVVAMLAWAVLPLFHAVGQSELQGVLMTLIYALVGAAIVLGLSPWLWPRSWAEVERALPIAKAARRRSDVLVVVLGLTPLWVVYAIGAATWLVQLPAWFRPIWATALLTLAVSMLLSLIAGVAILEWRRSLPQKSHSRWLAMPAQVMHTRRRMLSPTLSLLVLPLMRGPARRSGRLWVVVTGGLLAIALGVALWSRQLSWWLMAFAAWAQGGVTRLNVLVMADLEPLHAECAHLPIRAGWPLLARRAVVMAPLVLGMVSLLAAITFAFVPVKPFVLSCYVAVVGFGALALVKSASTPPVPGLQQDPSARVSWWLLILVTSMALGSNV